MLLLPKLRHQIIYSAVQALRIHHSIFLGITARQLASHAAVTRPIYRERAASQPFKVQHIRMLFGFACVLLLLALLLTQPAGTNSAPYVTYDEIPAVIVAPEMLQAAPDAIQAAPATPCSMLTRALSLCEP